MSTQQMTPAETIAFLESHEDESFELARRCVLAIDHNEREEINALKLWNILYPAQRELAAANARAEKAEKDSARRLSLLTRFFCDGQSLGASHPHFVSYLAHPDDLWVELRAELDASRAATAAEKERP